MGKFKNHNVCEAHTTDCRLHPDCKYKWGGAICTENAIIFHRCEFIIMTYCSCIRGHLSQNEFIAKMINDSMTGSKTIKWYDVSRSNVSDKELRRTIKEGNLMSKTVHEVNFLYWDNANRGYAICSDVLLYDSLIKNADLIKHNYEQTLEYIKNSDFDYLENTLNKLYDYNSPAVWDGIKHATVTEMNKYFKKLLKQKRKDYDAS